MRRILLVLLVAGAASLALDLAVAKHGHFAFEEWPGFQAAVGFLAAAAASLLARALAPRLKREERDDR